MAKLGLLFVAVFCLVQLSLAARVPRETPEVSTTSFLDQLQEGFNKAQEGLVKTFTKENGDKLLQTLKDGADTFGEKAKGWGTDISSKLSEIGKDIEKKLESTDAPTPAP